MNTKTDSTRPNHEQADNSQLSDDAVNPATVATESLDPTVCPRCRRSLPEDCLGQLCPYCLLADDLLDGSQFDSTRGSRLFSPPKIEDLQPFFQSLEIVSLIGHGGMGAVYRAHQRSLGRDVALKVLPPEVAATEGFLERFLREAHALARLGHPNIVAVYDHGTTGPYAYLVMELVEGVNLRDLMSGDRLPPEEAFQIVPQLCDALQYAHGRGVIHRDIKPENILIDESGTIKITDFGLAKLAETDEQYGRTATRQVMGTVHYMAPEQIERPREVDHRADLYSLGVVFYELLTGELPLGRFSPPSAKAGTTRQVDKVVFKSLEKEPDNRYSSAEEVRSDLNQQGSSAAAGAQAAVRAVDQRVRQAGHKMFSAASQINPSSRGFISLLLTLLFYGVSVIGVGAIIAAGNVFLLTTLIVLVFVAAYGLAAFYTDSPLPVFAAALERPVNWLAALPKRVFDDVIHSISDLDGIRVPWMLAALVSFAVGIYLIVLACTVDEDFAIGSMFAFLGSTVLTRIAVPRKTSPKTPTQRVVTFTPVLVVLLPLATGILVWPLVLWMTFVFQPEPSEWFANTTGIDESFRTAFRGGHVSMLLAQMFGGLTVETCWLSGLALLNALFPSATRWLARPVLDEWDGHWRWRIFAFLVCGFLVTWLAFTLATE